MPLTPADVRNKQFSTTRLRPGYDEEEVDAFLDEVEAELDRLIQENEELRAKLAECLRGKVPAMAAPTIEPKQELAQVHDLRQQQEPRREQREELERKVDDLRAFEREYRSRLKAYLEGQLRELDVSQDAGTFGGNNPAVTGPQPAVLAHADARNGQGAPVASGPTPFPPPGE